MKIGYSIRHHANMGNYESVEFSAWAEEEVRETSNGVNDGYANLRTIVENALETDMDEAANKSREKSTYVQYWKVED